MCCRLLLPAVRRTFLLASPGAARLGSEGLGVRESPGARRPRLGITAGAGPIPGMRGKRARQVFAHLVGSRSP